MSTKDLIRRAVEMWPDNVPLAAVRARKGSPLGQAERRTTREEKDDLRAAGWFVGTTPGWWELSSTRSEP